MRIPTLRSVVSVALGLGLAGLSWCRADEPGQVREFKLDWPVRPSAGDMHGDPPRKDKCGNVPQAPGGTTHEIVFRKDGNEFWITGGEHDHVARVTLEGKAEFFDTGMGSHPHGVLFDRDGRLWVSLEGKGVVARLDRKGNIEDRIDVRFRVPGASKPINTSPHGLGLDPDGKTVWFTGKKTNTVGRIRPDDSVEHFELPTVGAVPIYLAAGPDGAMWCTELVGNAIARISTAGEVKEYRIPTGNSRPIAIVPGPDGRSMWFSEEAGNKVARIDMAGLIDEYPVPLVQKNIILAGLAFDREANLWTQGYVNPADPSQAGGDYIIKIDKSILAAPGCDLSGVPITFFKVPSTNTVMHRILQGPDRNIWFTELRADQLGRLTIGGRR